jgi:phosphoserine phosphatase RsbU/P
MITDELRALTSGPAARHEPRSTSKSRYSADVVAARLRATAIGFSVEEPRDDIAILAIRNDS